MHNTPNREYLVTLYQDQDPQKQISIKTGSITARRNGANPPPISMIHEYTSKPKPQTKGRAKGRGKGRGKPPKKNRTSKQRPKGHLTKRKQQTLQYYKKDQPGTTYGRETAQTNEVQEEQEVSQMVTGSNHESTPETQNKAVAPKAGNSMPQEKSMQKEYVSHTTKHSKMAQLDVDSNIPGSQSPSTEKQPNSSQDNVEEDHLKKEHKGKRYLELPQSWIQEDPQTNPKKRQRTILEYTRVLTPEKKQDEQVHAEYTQQESSDWQPPEMPTGQNSQRECQLETKGLLRTKDTTKETDQQERTDRSQQ